MAGGFNGNDLDSALLYRVDTDQWRTAAKLNGKRAGGEIVVVNGRVLYMGGYGENVDFQRQYPASQNRNRMILMPEKLYLPIDIYLAPSWTRKFGGFGGGKEKAKQILSKVRTLFLHHSLETKIHIKFNDANIFPTSEDLAPIIRIIYKD